MCSRTTSDLFLRVLATSRLFRVLFPNRVRFNKVYFQRGQNRYPQRVSQPEGVHFLHFASKGSVDSVLWHSPPPHLAEFERVRCACLPHERVSRRREVTTGVHLCAPPNHAKCCGCSCNTVTSVRCQAMVYTVPGNVTHADTPAMRCIPTLPATFSK